MIAFSAAMAPKASTNLARLAFAAVILGGIAMVTPFGSKIIAVLPFIGTAESWSVTYRQQLLQVSWDVLMLNPMLGSPSFLDNPAMQQLRVDGEGLIDMVNSYLGVALASGFVGLGLFVGAFATSAIRLRSGLLRVRREEGYDDIMGRALLGALIGALVTIYTVSSINVIPVIYWCLAGACAGYARRLEAIQADEVQGKAFLSPKLRKS
jgi:O-antigen ligase